MNAQVLLVFYGMLGSYTMSGGQDRYEVRFNDEMPGTGNIPVFADVMRNPSCDIGKSQGTGRYAR